MQLGIRYILPAFPFVFLLLSQVAEWVAPVRRSLLGAGSWLWILAYAASARFQPHHLGYFNEFSGGPPAGWLHLSDSNIDWGQDLNGLRDWLDEHPVLNLQLAYFGTSQAGKLGIPHELAPINTPQPGWYAASVCLIQGRPTPVRRPDGSTVGLSINAFAYLQFFEPVDYIGSSIRIYHLTESDCLRYQSAVQRQRRL